MVSFSPSFFPSSFCQDKNKSPEQGNLAQILIMALTILTCLFSRPWPGTKTLSSTSTCFLFRRHVFAMVLILLFPATLICDKTVPEIFDGETAIFLLYFSFILKDFESFLSQKHSAVLCSNSNTHSKLYILSLTLRL